MNESNLDFPSSKVSIPLFLQRISIKEIKSHPWFLKNLPKELTEPAQAAYYQRDNPSFASLQSVEEIMKIVGEARNPAPVARTVPEWEGENEDENNEGVEEAEEEEEDEEDEYDKTVKQVHASGEFIIS